MTTDSMDEAQQDPRAVALMALVWTLEAPHRARRLLDLTGLTPDALRSGVDDDAVLVAVCDFLAHHESDLVGAAQDLGLAPGEIVAARDRLAG